MAWDYGKSSTAGRQYMDYWTADPNYTWLTDPEGREWLRTASLDDVKRELSKYGIDPNAVSGRNTVTGETYTVSGQPIAEYLRDNGGNEVMHQGWLRSPAGQAWTKANPGKDIRSSGDIKYEKPSFWQKYGGLITVASMGLGSGLAASGAAASSATAPGMLGIANVPGGGAAFFGGPAATSTLASSAGGVGAAAGGAGGVGGGGGGVLPTDFLTAAEGTGGTMASDYLPTAATTTAKTGGGGVMGFAKDNPLLAAMGLKTAGSLLQKSPKVKVIDPNYVEVTITDPVTRKPIKARQYINPATTQMERDKGFTSILGDVGSGAADAWMTYQMLKGLQT